MSYPTQAGYSNIPTGGNPRQTEAWALTEAARRMSEAQRAEVPEADFLNAIRLNWRLWTIFQAELSSPDCALPVELRQNMLSLANFVDKTTVDLLVNTQRQRATTLININRQIAAGLFSIPPGAAEAEAVAAPTGIGSVDA